MIYRALRDNTRRNACRRSAEFSRITPRSRRRRPSPVGGQGATTVNITEFSVGRPRNWNLRIETRADGTMDTIVNPVRVKYKVKSFYRDQNKVTADREQLFACHVDVDRWVCGPDQVLKEGQKSVILVKKE